MDRKAIVARRKRAFELYEQKIPQDQIAQELAVHPVTLKHWIALYVRGNAKGLLLETEDKTPYSPELRMTAARMHEEEGMSHADIAAALNLRNSDCVRAWCRQYRKDKGIILPRPKGRPRTTPRPQSVDARLRELEMEVDLLKKVLYASGR